MCTHVLWSEKRYMSVFSTQHQNWRQRGWWIDSVGCYMAVDSTMSYTDARILVLYATDMHTTRCYWERERERAISDVENHVDALAHALVSRPPPAHPLSLPTPSPLHSLTTTPAPCRWQIRSVTTSRRHQYRVTTGQWGISEAPVARCWLKHALNGNTRADQFV